MSRGQVVGLRPVGGQVVQLPDVVLEAAFRIGDHLPGDAVPGHRHPALVIDATVAAHLEVLSGTPVRSIGGSKRVAHAGALDRLLLNAVHQHRGRHADAVQDGREHIDDVVELRAHATAPGDPAGPVDDQPVPVPPKCEATCFVHW